MQTEITDKDLKARSVGDWNISGSASSLDLQRQLDEMARWYLLKYKDFIKVAQENDASIKRKSYEDARDELLTYPGVKAIAAHEIAHHLYESKENNRSNKILARKLSEAAHSQTGIDIHPGTKIGKNCFLDHGTGDVIGETAKIGDDTMIYHDVTLGAYIDPKEKNPKILEHRHPEIGNDCTIAAGVKIFGNVKVGNGVKIAPETKIYGNNIKIGDGVSIGTDAKIGDKNEIANGVHIGSGAVIPRGIGKITENVPSYSQARKGEDGAIHFDKLSQLGTKVDRIIGYIEGIFCDVSSGIKSMVGVSAER